MQEDVRKKWLIEDNTLVSLYRELLELLYTATSFSYSEIYGALSYYALFEPSLKALVVLNIFLYE